MNTKHSAELKKVYLKYQTLHEKLHELERETQELLENRSKISQELDETRRDEKFLINKIEEEINRPVTQEDLIQIIKTDD